MIQRGSSPSSCLWKAEFRHAVGLVTVVMNGWLLSSTAAGASRGWGCIPTARVISWLLGSPQGLISKPPSPSGVRCSGRNCCNHSRAKGEKCCNGLETWGAWAVGCKSPIDFRVQVCSLSWFKWQLFIILHPVKVWIFLCSICLWGRVQFSQLEHSSLNDKSSHN